MVRDMDPAGSVRTTEMPVADPPEQDARSRPAQRLRRLKAAVVLRRKAIVAVAVGGIVLLAAGAVIGYVVSGPDRDAFAALKQDHAEAAEAVESMSATIVERESEIAQLEDEVRERGAVIAGIEMREAEASQREAALDARESALNERERAVEDTEAEIEANTVPGDGIWRVGDEIKPGVYKAQGSGSSCYWARLDSLGGGDVISNHFGSASVSVELYKSDTAFETSGCGSWIKQ